MNRRRLLGGILASPAALIPVNEPEVIVPEVVTPEPEKPSWANIILAAQMGIIPKSTALEMMGFDDYRS